MWPKSITYSCPVMSLIGNYISWILISDPWILNSFYQFCTWITVVDFLAFQDKLTTERWSPPSCRGWYNRVPGWARTANLGFRLRQFSDQPQTIPSRITTVSQRVMIKTAIWIIYIFVLTLMSWYVFCEDINIYSHFLLFLNTDTAR